MKKLIPLASLILLVFMVTPVHAEPSATIQLTPTPEYNQVWAYETYTVNITINEFNLTNIDITNYTGSPSELLLDGSVYWEGKGGYDFGAMTAGYSYDLDETDVNDIIAFGEDHYLLNLTLDKNMHKYKMKPYESIEVTIKFDIYLVMNDSTLGPKISSVSEKYEMIDETKVKYIKGKYSEMQEEINTTIQASGLEAFNRQRYQDILDVMNISLTRGDYVEALDIWDNYNEKDRLDLIDDVISASDMEYVELVTLRDVEERFDSIQLDLELLQSQHDQLENTYVALANTYNKVNQQLETAKGNLSTAITTVFLSAIVFYFLGRRGARKEAEKQIA